MRNVLVAGGIVRDVGCRKVAGTLGPTFRAARPADAEALARAMLEGFEGYREFRGAGLGAAAAGDEIALQRRILVDEAVWCRPAETEGRLVGQVAFLPVAKAAEPIDDAGLARLRAHAAVHPGPTRPGTALLRAGAGRSRATSSTRRVPPW